MRVTIRAGLALAAARPMRQLTDNLAKSIGAESVDAVHDLRVALRRIEALLRVSRDLLPAERVRHLRTELRWLRRNLGPIRDLDVLTTDIVPELARAMSGEHALDVLVAAALSRRPPLIAILSDLAAGRRCREMRAALAELFDDDCGAIGLDFGARPKADVLDGSWSKFAHATLRQRFKKLIRAADGLNGLEDAALHELRIKARTFRYLCDHFSALMPPSRYIALKKALGDLQDRMGQHNDAVNAPHLAQSLARDPPAGGDGAALVRAAGIVAGWGAMRREWSRAQIPMPWARVIERAEKLFAAWKE